MTKEELEKATGQELIDERNYCGVDGYYGVYLDNVNAEMLKRFNRLAELEQENADLKEEVNKVAFENGELKEENAELKLKLEALEGQTPWKDIKDKSELIKENVELEEELQKWKDEWQEQVQKATDEGYARTLQTIQLTKAKELLERLLITSCNSDVLNLLPNCSEVLRVRVEAEQFLNSEVEK